MNNNNSNTPPKRRSPVRKIGDIGSGSAKQSASQNTPHYSGDNPIANQIDETAKLLSSASNTQKSNLDSYNIATEVPQTVNKSTFQNQTVLDGNSSEILVSESRSSLKKVSEQATVTIELNNPEAEQTRVLSPIPKSTDINAARPQTSFQNHSSRTAKPASAVKPNVVKNAGLNSGGISKRQPVANRTQNNTAPTLTTQISNVSLHNTASHNRQQYTSGNQNVQMRTDSTRNLQAHETKPTVRGIDYEYVKTPSAERKNVNIQKKSKKDRKEEYSSSGGTLSSVIKALIYITCVFVISGVLSYFAISIGNDVFAFVKSDAQYELAIPSSATINDISQILYSNGIIKYPEIFKIYSYIRKDDGAFVEGTYTVSPSLDYDDLLSAFKDKKTTQQRTEVSITIPEGYTVDEIIDLFVSRGMSTREDFVDVIQNYDFDFWFVKELTDLPEGRTYRLEGYLFPDTYYFYSDSSAATIIYKLLSNFNNKFPESYKERCEALGMTVDQIITLASMIQMEAKYADEYGKVSSVFHNRLNNPSVTNGKLESDATIQYALSERKSELTSDDLRIDSPYNSYLYAGLPPGPISNPSLNAISYAMYPDKTDYYFFVATSTGRSLFASTNEEHNQNKITARGGN